MQLFAQSGHCRVPGSDFFDHLRPLPGPCIKCLSFNFMFNSSVGCLKCCMRIMNEKYEWLHLPCMYVRLHASFW